MKKLSLFPVLAMLFAAYSCSKSGGGATQNFQPLTTGSSWTYTDSNLTTTTSSNYTLTVSGTDTNINSRLYKIFNSSNGANQYYNISGSDYYQYRSLGAGTSSIEFLYLKDNYNTGQTWNTTSTINFSFGGTTVPVNVSIVYKIEEKLSSYTVAGKTYSDVVRVSATPSFSITPPLFTITTPVNNIQFYYARGIGMVFNKFQLTLAATGLSGLPAVSTETRLKSYTIL